MIDRVFFDKALAHDAAKAGAEIMLKTSAVSLIKEGGTIKGAKLVSHGENIEVHAGAVVGADGYESQVGRWAGIDTSIKPQDIDTCYQYRLTNIKDFDPDYCEFFLGKVAPGGYAWVFPKDEDTANVGLGVLGTLAKQPGDVKKYLEKFIANDKRFRDAQPLEAVSGAVSICAPLEKTSMDGLLLVGDSARMIDPITGGGIINGCIAGKYAGETLAKAAGSKDFTMNVLQEYEDAWRGRMENKLWRNWMAKEKLVTLNDDTLDKIVHALSEVGVGKLSIENILIAIGSRYPELVKEFQQFL